MSKKVLGGEVSTHTYTNYYLKAGYYKLGGNVTTKAGEHIYIREKVTLDLNGHTIKIDAPNSTVIVITKIEDKSGSLTLNDSKGNGTILGYIVNYATFTMYGGSIHDEVLVGDRDPVSVIEATFNMVGGDCKDIINYRNGTITGGQGACYGEVENNGTITGGVFYGEVENDGVISGGVFLGEITGDGEITGAQHKITLDLGNGEKRNGFVVGNTLYPLGEPPVTREGYKFVGWFDENDKEWDFEEQPADLDGLKLTAKWEEIPTEDETPDGAAGLAAILDDVPFVDVDFNDYFYDSVKWAYHFGVTGGTDAWHFSPDAGCTRAQAVTFLWRAAGCPSASYLGNFADVDADAYYAPAVAWAVANGVTNGTSATTFSPEAACSRGDIVTFLYRAFGGVSNGYHPFTDVPASAYYADAVAWAYEHNVTGGTSADKFSPADACSRAEIVTFLYRVKG